MTTPTLRHFHCLAAWNALGAAAEAATWTFPVKPKTEPSAAKNGPGS